MATPQRIIQGLPEFSWRGIKAPYAAANVSTSFDLAERKYYGVDGAAHDNTGRNSDIFPIRLLFFNTIEEGLFPDRYNQMFNATHEDRTPGDLNHPILGQIRARVQTVDYQLVAEATAGAAIDISFVETREEIDVLNVSTGADVTAEAAAAATDAAIAPLGISYPTGITATPTAASTLPTSPGGEIENATSFEEAFSLAKSQLFSASLTLNAALTQISTKLAAVIDAIRTVQDHKRWPALANALLFWRTLQQIRLNAERLVARAVSVRVVQTDTTLDIFARDVGNSLADVIGLNLRFAGKPNVSKGESLRFYSGVAVGV